MASLNGLISFTVEFDLTGIPTMVLRVNTTLPDVKKPFLNGYFTITQPDGITTTGDNPSVIWVPANSDYNEYRVPLRLASDQRYQRGTYTVTFYGVQNANSGSFTRTWDMEYLPATQTFLKLFDCFTPSLAYQDTTNYQVSGYDVLTDSQAWSALFEAISASVESTITIAGTSAVFDLIYNGSYYDSSYTITHTKSILYRHQTDTWLTVREQLITNITADSFIPVTLAIMLSWLITLKSARDASVNCQGNYEELDERFEDANGLFQFIKVRVCAQNLTNLQASFEEFYRLTHNFQSPNYQNTFNPIPAYDFTTGCTGGAPPSTGIVIINAVVGGIINVTGSANTPIGIVDGSVSIQMDDFTGVRVAIFKGDRPIINIDPGGGGAYYTKALGSDTIVFTNTACATGELLIIQTIP